MMVRLATPDGGHITLLGPARGECHCCSQEHDEVSPLIISPPAPTLAERVAAQVALTVCGGCLAGALAVRFAAHDVAAGRGMPQLTVRQVLGQHPPTQESRTA